MSKFTITKRTEVPAGRLWEIISDFGNIYQFNPNVRASKLSGSPGQAHDLKQATKTER